MFATLVEALRQGGRYEGMGTLGSGEYVSATADFTVLPDVATFTLRVEATPPAQLHGILLPSNELWVLDPNHGRMLRHAADASEEATVFHAQCDNGYQQCLTWHHDAGTHAWSFASTGADSTLETRWTVQLTRPQPREESVTEVPLVDPITVEVHPSLASLVNPAEGGQMFERIASIRGHLAREMGFGLPGVRFRDNSALEPSSYRIQIRSATVAKGELRMDRLLVWGRKETLQQTLQGEHVLDPTYGIPGVWISVEDRPRAAELEVLIFDAVSVLSTRFTEVVRRNAADLLDRQQVRNLLDVVRSSAPAAVEGIVPDLFSLGEIAHVLRNLLREQVSIRDLPVILETLADNVRRTRDLEDLTECVRVALSRFFCPEHCKPAGTLPCIILDPDLEHLVLANLQRSEDGSTIANEKVRCAVLEQVQASVQQLRARGMYAVLVCAAAARPAIRHLTAPVLPRLVVLSLAEVPLGIEVRPVSVISIPG